jgi:hypothetical protein
MEHDFDVFYKLKQLIMKLLIEEITKFDFPKLNIKWNNGETSVWNVEQYLNKIIRTPESEYWKIIEPEIFEKAFVKDGFIQWDGIISQLYCGGDMNSQPVFFSSGEIAKELGN